MVVGQDDQNDQSDTTEESQQAQPFGMSFADGVVHAAPDEKDGTHYDENQAHGSTQDPAPDKLKNETEAYANVRVGFVFR